MQLRTWKRAMKATGQDPEKFPTKSRFHCWALLVRMRDSVPSVRPAEIVSFRDNPENKSLTVTMTVELSETDLMSDSP